MFIYLFIIACITIIVYIILLMFNVNLELFQENAQENAQENSETIFISLASYRDMKCPQTVKSLFENAKYPFNIFVGICQQNAEEDVDCQFNDIVPKEYLSQVRSIRIKNYEAKGPTWARYLCSTLLQNEKYYMQIDSHILFSKDWDEKLISMIKKLKEVGVKKPILSHYPDDFAYYPDKKPASAVPSICRSFFNERGMISFEGAEDIHYNKADLPMPNAYLAAGMTFSEASFVKEVPYDPNLPYLFVGEEILHSIRAWTHGWDIFTPTENVTFHYYTRADDVKIWTDLSYTDEEAHNKVKSLLNLQGVKELSPAISKNIEYYGLGSERTLQQYLEFAGIDKENEKVNRDFCRDRDIRDIYAAYAN